MAKVQKPRPVRKIRKTWTPEKMISAIKLVMNNECGYKIASKLHKVPLTSSKRHVSTMRNKKIPAEEADKVVKVPLGRKPALSVDLEKELVQYCLQMDSTYYGLRRRDIKRMAFQLALRNNLNHPFSATTATAGKKWLCNFQRRYPELSFRKPQAINMVRVQAFTKENVDRFFEIIKPELVAVKFQGHRVFNVDETGVTTVQHSSESVLTFKGKKAVHKLSSAERGGLITIVICMSAAGQFVPPMVIFPRKTRKDAFGDGLPAGSITEYSLSSWITAPLFTKWFAHFITVTNSSKGNPCVLIFDGHFSHTRNIDLINLAKKNGVSLVCLPPHTSDKLQPLDVAFMKPVKSYYASGIETWLHTHPGRIVTHGQVAPLFATAYKLAATMVVAENGFRATGIIPYNPAVFKPEDFKIGADNVRNQRALVNESSPIVEPGTPQPSTLTQSTVLQTPSGSDTANSSSQSIVTPEDIIPIPIIPDAPESNRRGRAELISSSPYKNILVLARQKQKPVKRAKKTKVNSNRAAASKKTALSKKSTSFKKPAASKNVDGGETSKKSNINVTKPKRKPAKRKLEFSESESDCDDVSYASSTDLSDDDDCCQFCGESYKTNNHGEVWIMCRKCYLWCHEACDAAVDECKSKKKYICSTCLNL